MCRKHQRAQFQDVSPIIPSLLAFLCPHTCISSIYTCTEYTLYPDCSSETTHARPHSRRPRVRVGHAQVLCTRMRVGTMALAFFSCVFPRCWLPAIHRSLLLGDGARPCWSKGTTGFRSFRAEPRGVRLRPSGGAGGPGTARPACLGELGRGCGSATGAGRTAGVPASGASAARLVEHAEGDGGICAPSLGGSWMCRLLLSSSKT